MRKQLFTLLLALAASLGTMFAESGTCGENLTWDLTDGVLTISGTGTMENYSSSNDAPWYSSKSSIKTLIIGDGVTSIGDYAFSWCNITSVTIGKDVTNIGNNAFNYCYQLISLSIPNNVISIGNYAFTACSRLISVEIGSSVTSMGNDIFDNCKSLTSINVAVDNSNYCSVDGVLFDKNKATLIRYPLGKQGSSYVIPSSVTSIVDYAFKGCANLTSIEIPNIVTGIGYRAFQDCKSLTSINVAVDNSNYCSVDGVLFDKNKTTLIQYPKGKQGISYMIPNSVKKIEDLAFEGCEKLTTIEIPNCVTDIGSFAFDGCSSLTSIDIPNSVIFIGMFAFNECVSLVSATIGSSVKFIGNYTFSDCTALTSVVWNAVHCADFISTLTPFFYSSNYTSLNYDLRPHITSFVFGEDVEYIPAYLCAGMENAEIVIKNCKTEIGEHALDNCNYTYTTEKLPDFTITIKHEYDSYNSGSISYKIVDANYSGKYYYTLNGEKGCSLYNLSKGNYRLVFYGEECGDSIVKNITINQYGMKVNGMYYLLDENYHTAKVTYRGTSYDDYNGEYSGNITIPKKITFDGKEYKVTGIGTDAFYGCNNISSITMESETPISMYSSGLSNNCIIYVPYGSLNAYKSASGWRNYTIHVINPSHVTTTTGATSATITLGNTNEAQHIASCGMEGGEEFAGNVIEYIGLEPNSEYANIPLFIKTKEGDMDNTTVSFSTTALELTTKPSKPVSSNTAILLAETNMSDAEISCGFEWKRNDAPADMDGNKVYCPVASGQMAGRLKNLKDDVYYKYRAFYQSAAGKMYYGDWQYIFTGDVTVEFDPVLYTYGATVVHEKDATISGYALAGSEDFTEQGFEYWSESRANGGANVPHRMPAALGEHIFVQASGIALRVTLTNLDAGTVYKYRVYGKVGDQYYYGAEQSFTTTGTYTPPTYTIIFVNWDGSELQSSQVTEDEMPEYTGETPERPADEQYTYTFIGWSPVLATATADATYTATYEANSREGVDNIYLDSQVQKLFRDGQILILRGDKTFTLQGQEIK